MQQGKTLAQSDEENKTEEPSPCLPSITFRKKRNCKFILTKY